MAAAKEADMAQGLRGLKLIVAEQGRTIQELKNTLGQQQEMIARLQRAASVKVRNLIAGTSQ